MADTLTRYLKLKIADDLSADAKYNLQRIDSLGANLAGTFVSGAGDRLSILSRGDIQLVANDSSIGGSGSGGTITLGDDSNLVNVLVQGTSFKLRCGLQLPSGSSGGNDTYLTLLSSTNNLNQSLNLNLSSGNKSLTIAHSGDIVVADAAQILTAKTISGNDNTISNIGYGSLVLTSSIVNADISATAAITTSKLSGPLTAVASNGLGTLAVQNTASLTTDVTGTLPILNGGTGATSSSSAIANLLPAYGGNNDRVLALNSSGTSLEWKLAGSGTLTGISASFPLSVDNTNPVQPLLLIAQGSALQNGYISSSDWSLFNSKEPSLAAAPIDPTSKYYRGDKSWRTLDKSVVGLLNVDNTSDADKPISSATQTALNAKYDASNPSAFVDAAGAKTAAVVNSTSGTETDQAPSVAAIKAYITAQGSGAVTATWSTADGAVKAVTHSLNKLTVSVTVYDENGEDILVDTVDRTDVNTVTLTSSVAPTGNWTVIIRP